MSIKLDKLHTILASNGQDGVLFVAKDGRAAPATKTQKEGLFCLRQVAVKSYEAQLDHYNRGIKQLIRAEQARTKQFPPVQIPKVILDDFGPNAKKYVVLEGSPNWSD